MATIADSEFAEMSAGRAINLAFATIRNNPGVTLGMALLVGAIPGLLVTFASTQFPEDAMVADRPAFWGMMALSIIGSMVISSLTQGFLTRATVAQAEGRKASLGECVQASVSVLLPLMALAIVTSVGIALGMVLLIVPGFMLMIAWSVATPAMVEERTGIFESIERSNDLTRGARWKIFSLMIAVGFLAWIASIAVDQLMGVDTSDPAAAFRDQAYLLVSILVGTLSSLVTGTVQSAIYVELRNWKDGPVSAHLEQVFA